MRQGIKKVLFIEPVFAHYRHDTFNNIFKTGNLECYLLAGTNYEGIKESDLPDAIKSKYIKLYLGFNTFYYLKGTLHFLRSYKPDIIVCSGIDFRHLHTLLAFLWSRFFKVKFVWWSHAGLGNQGRIGQKLRAIFYMYSEGVLAYSNKGKNNLTQLGIPEGNVRVVGNALNSSDYGFDAVNKNPQDEAILLFSGRITPEKKLDVLIRALKILKEHGIKFKCLIAGGGDLESYQELVENLSLKNEVVFLGPKYGEELKAYFSKSMLFVYPGGIGLSMVQALSHGLPVITTDAFKLHGPEIELLSPGVTGDLFRDGDSNELAIKIEEWLKKLRNEKEIIASVCRNRVKEYGYLPEMVASKITEFINHI